MLINYRTVLIVVEMSVSSVNPLAVSLGVLGESMGDKRTCHWAKGVRHPPEPLTRLCCYVSARAPLCGRRQGSKLCRAGEEGVLKALTTRDSLGLGPLEIKLLRVTISI